MVKGRRNLRDRKPESLRWGWGYQKRPMVRALLAPNRKWWSF